MKLPEFTADQVREHPELLFVLLVNQLLEQPGEVTENVEEGLSLEFKKDLEYPVVDPRDEKWICAACNKEFNGITIIEHNRMWHNFP